MLSLLRDLSIDLVRQTGKAVSVAQCGEWPVQIGTGCFGGMEEAQLHQIEGGERLKLNPEGWKGVK